MVGTSNKSVPEMPIDKIYRRILLTKIFHQCNGLNGGGGFDTLLKIFNDIWFFFLKIFNRFKLESGRTAPPEPIFTNIHPPNKGARVGKYTCF